jgi:hypothetical protein
LDPSDSSFGYAAAENAHGDIAGQICNSVICNAVLWRKRGGHWKTTILGTTAQISFGWSINASDQVVGVLYLANGTAAFVSENGGRVVDLNTLIPPGSGLQLYEADQVNDLGEISVQGNDANGNNHVVVLIPCDENHPDVEGCDYGFVEAGSAIKNPWASNACESKKSHVQRHEIWQGSSITRARGALESHSQLLVKPKMC